MLVQSIVDLKNTTDELNSDLESFGEDDTGGKHVHPCSFSGIIYEAVCHLFYFIFMRILN